MQRWPAPAKLNLLLKIVAQREDGYHQLQTVFQFIDLCDYLGFVIRQDGQIQLTSQIPNVNEKDNLVIQAALLLQQTSGTPLGTDISLQKNIPMGGGLGGGSSDAATTLLALNQLWNTGLETRELAQLGLRLGADVPVFIYGQAAWAEGIGEILTPIEPQEPWYLLVKPDCEVATAQIFGDCRLTRDADRITIRDFLSGQHGNDCSAVVQIRYPQVKAALQWLGEFSRSRLTGTGSCIFAAFDSQEAAIAVHEQLPEPWIGWVCRGLNKSPIMDLLNV